MAGWISNNEGKCPTDFLFGGLAHNYGASLRTKSDVIVSTLYSGTGYNTDGLNCLSSTSSLVAA